MRMLSRIGLVAAFAFVFLPAIAGELVAPVPAAVAFPAAAGPCLDADVAIAALQEIKAENPASRAFALIRGVQQDFADAWRAPLRLPSTKVHITLAWLADGVAAVSEFGPDNCLVTATIMSAGQWDVIVAALRHSRGS